MAELPIIDISGLRSSEQRHRRKIIRDIGDACHDIGFMYISGHGIPEETVARIRQAALDFFSRPKEEKLRLSISRDNYRGYIPLGFFTPNKSGLSKDNYEGYKLHAETDPADPICAQCPIYGPNKWPANIPGFRQAVLRYWSECDRVMEILMCALASVLGVDPTIFRDAFVKPLTNMTLLHYPPQTPGDSGFGIHPHKDTDALTILAPDPIGGLQVKRKNRNKWMSADAPPGALIVNIGDMLELWSGGYFTSTPHKVVNGSGDERYSFPYFAVPRHDTVVRPLCRSQKGFSRPVLNVGEVSREVWRTNWADAIPAIPELDLGTLPD